MDIVAVVLGALLITVILGIIVGVTVLTDGWRVALTIWGLSLATTTVLAGGVALVSWGIAGHW